MSPDLSIAVPVHGIATGKTRLAPVLAPVARAMLNRRLLEHTLEVVARWRGGLERCIVVSACAESLAIAARHGASAVAEPHPPGLNSALALAAAAAANGGARRLLVLACDLPGLAPDALAELERAATPARHMAIAPDAREDGTNALLAPLEAPFEFRYGATSFARHLALAAARGWPAVVVKRPELSRDLDTPDDLANWPELASVYSGAPAPW